MERGERHREHKYAWYVICVWPAVHSQSCTLPEETETCTLYFHETNHRTNSPLTELQLSSPLVTPLMVAGQCHTSCGMYIQPSNCWQWQLWCRSGSSECSEPCDRWSCPAVWQRKHLISFLWLNVGYYKSFRIEQKGRNTFVVLLFHCLIPLCSELCLEKRNGLLVPGQQERKYHYDLVLR